MGLIQEHDCATGRTVVREMTEEEQARHEQAQAEGAAYERRRAEHRDAVEPILAKLDADQALSAAEVRLLLRAALRRG